MRYSDYPIGTKFGRYVKVIGGEITDKFFCVESLLHTEGEVDEFCKPVKFCVPEEFFE